VSTTERRSGSVTTKRTSDPAVAAARLEPVRDGLARDGVAKVGSVLNPAHIERILRWLDTREADSGLLTDLQPTFDVAADGRRRISKIRRLFWSDPQFWADLFVTSRILDVATGLAGPEATLLFHTGFLKPGGIGSEMTLHQDQGVTPWDLPYVITMWIAVTPSTLANGCIIGYPGSHRQGLIPHALEDGTVVDRSAAALRALPSIPAARFAGETPMPYELQPGEAVAWHHFFVHGSAENRSGMDRKGIALVFADASRPGFVAPDVDFSGRRMEPISVAAIRALAGTPVAGGTH
jgi:Phytanoyl-CoA dioxygenase (PhyH)